ncbi:CidA/LrgA family protein [Paraburkholderia sp. J12]|uniref:CidA/LrgA family protein n=1 Tax=Paraburkholderia sp. J12 TaxID=2805432 RepID=UPI002ABD7B22|nr:CidA/LrgA family protein [Paraburkholderia sp. J12]
MALTLLVGAQLAGEVLRRVLHLPLPGPVIGMFVLAVALVAASRRRGADSVASPSTLDNTASTLISNMGLLFVPAGVGIISELNLLRQEWLPIVAGLVVSTVLGLVVTGVVMHRVTRRAELRQAAALANASTETR